MRSPHMLQGWLIQHQQEILLKQGSKKQYQVNDPISPFKLDANCRQLFFFIRLKESAKYHVKVLSKWNTPNELN